MEKKKGECKVCGHEKDQCACFIPFARVFDFERSPFRSLMVVLAIRFLRAMVFNQRTYHADQNWQGVEIAYHMAYGD